MPAPDPAPPRPAAFSRRRFLALSALGLGVPSGIGMASWRRRPAAEAAVDPTATTLVPPSVAAACAATDNADSANRGDALGVRRIVWSVPTAGARMALTFDDGPHPELTPAILRVLADAGVQATFYMVGHAVESFPALARAVVDAGHEVGNHTATHLDLSQQDAATTAAQLRDGSDAIRRVTGRTPRSFRPPRGNLTGAAVREAALLGQDVVLWSTSGTVQGATTTAQVVEGAMGALGPGGIVCLHDGVGRGMFNPDKAWAVELLRLRRLEVQALPDLLAAIRGRGLRCTTVSDLIEAGNPAV